MKRETAISCKIKTLGAEVIVLLSCALDVRVNIVCIHFVLTTVINKSTQTIGTGRFGSSTHHSTDICPTAEVL